MKERLPALIAAMLLATLVALTWWAADYAQRAVAIDPPRRLTHEPDSWGDDFIMLRTDEKGTPVNRLEGTYVQHFPDDDSYEVTEPRATGLRTGSPVTVGTSRTAIMDQDGQRITMRGDAHLHRLPDAERAALDVRSDVIVLLPDEDRAYTDLPAEVVNGRSRMNGTGMSYNNRTRQLQVYSSTDVEIAGEQMRSRRGEPRNPPSSSPSP